MTSFLIGRKLLKYFNDLNDFAKMSISKQTEIKSNRICANMTVFFAIYKVVHYSMTFEIYLLTRIISKMNDNSIEGKMSFI